MNAHTPTPTPPVTATSTAALMSLLDPEASTDVADTMEIFNELIASCQPQPHTAADWDKVEPTPVELAAAAAYTATRHWMSLHEKRSPNHSADMYAALCGAHENMRDRHAILADQIEIEAIGDVGGGRRIGPGYYGMGLGLYDDGDDVPLMYLPRGLGRENILLILRTHDAAFAMGVRAGGNEVRAALAALTVHQ